MGWRGSAVPVATESRRHVFRLEEQVWRIGTERSEAAAAAGGGEPSAEAYRARTDGIHAGAEAGGPKKVVSPQMRREAVVVMHVGSQRGACGLMGLHRRLAFVMQDLLHPKCHRKRLRVLASKSLHLVRCMPI